MLCFDVCHSCQAFFRFLFYYSNRSSDCFCRHLLRLANKDEQNREDISWIKETNLDEEAEVFKHFQSGTTYSPSIYFLV